MQEDYLTCHSFIESVCAELGCRELARPLREGFSVLCESMTPGNLELARYFRNLKPSRTPKDFSEMDGDVFTRSNPHFDRWVVHNTENALDIYENGFQYGSEPGKLAYTDRYDSGRFAFATPLENATPPDFDKNRRLRYCETFDVGGSIVFKASGVTAFHKDDREDEVIFDKDSPESCFWIRNVNHRAWASATVDDDGDHELVDRYEVVGNNPDRPLCTGTYDRCIRWCRDNGDAYAHMMKRWKSPENTTKTESMMAGNSNSLCEAYSGDIRNSFIEIPGSFWPTTGVQAKVDAKLRQLGIVVDWSTYTPSRNRSWASQGLPSGTAKAYTVPEAEKAGSYTTYNRRTICFYVSVSELARTPVEMYDVDTSMGSNYREIGVDTKFVPPEEPVGK